MDNAGSLELLKWLHEHNKEDLTDDAMDDAVEKDDFERLEYLVSIGSPPCTGQVAVLVAYHEDLEMLLWLHAHYPELINADGYRQDFSDHSRLIVLLDRIGL